MIKFIVVLMCVVLGCSSCLLSSNVHHSGNVAAKKPGAGRCPEPVMVRASVKELKELLPEKTYKEITAGADTPACKEWNRKALNLPDKPNIQWYYTYGNMIEGMSAVSKFASDGKNDEMNKLEIASFLANVAQETGGHMGGQYGEPGCFIQELNEDYCYGTRYAEKYKKLAPTGAGFCGRGPHQLSYDYNYEVFSNSMGVNNTYLDDPECLVLVPKIGIAGSIWFWNQEVRTNKTPPPGPPFKPSAHDVVAGKWSPTEYDKECGRTEPNLGVITNIINGGIECGPTASPSGRQNAKNRVSFFKAIAKKMGIRADVYEKWAADDCSTQKNFEKCPSYEPPKPAEAQRCGFIEDNGWSNANKVCGKLCSSKEECPSVDGKQPECYSDLDVSPCKK